MKTISEQTLEGLQKKNIVLAEDENSHIWLLGAYDIVEQDKDRTKLLAEISKLAKRKANDQTFGTEVRKLINFFDKTQKSKNQSNSVLRD